MNENVAALHVGIGTGGEKYAEEMQNVFLPRYLNAHGIQNVAWYSDNTAPSLQNLKDVADHEVILGTLEATKREMYEISLPRITRILEVMKAYDNVPLLFNAGLSGMAIIGPFVESYRQMGSTKKTGFVLVDQVIPPNPREKNSYFGQSLLPDFMPGHNFFLPRVMEAIIYGPIRKHIANELGLEVPNSNYFGLQKKLMAHILTINPAMIPSKQFTDNIQVNYVRNLEDLPYQAENTTKTVDFMQNAVRNGKKIVFAQFGVMKSVAPDQVMVENINALVNSIKEDEVLVFSGLGGDIQSAIPQEKLNQIHIINGPSNHTRVLNFIGNNNGVAISASSAGIVAQTLDQAVPLIDIHNYAKQTPPDQARIRKTVMEKGLNYPSVDAQRIKASDYRESLDLLGQMSSAEKARRNKFSLEALAVDPYEELARELGKLALKLAEG